MKANDLYTSAIAIVACLAFAGYAAGQGRGVGRGGQVPSSAGQNQMSQQGAQNSQFGRDTANTNKNKNQPPVVSSPSPGASMTPRGTPPGHHYGWQKGKHNPHRSPSASPSASVSPTATP